MSTQRQKFPQTKTRKFITLTPGQLEVLHQGGELVVLDAPVKVPERRGRIRKRVDPVANPVSRTASVPVALPLHVKNLKI